MKKILNFLCVFLYMCIFTACPFFKNSKEELPEYKPDVLWTKKFIGYSFLMIPEQYDNFIYGIETQEIDDVYYSHVYKFDLATGEFIWKTKDFKSRTEHAPILIKNKVYIYSNFGKFLCFDDETAELLATVVLAKDEESSVKNAWCFTTINVNDEYICYSYENNNHLNDDGIMRLKLSDIDFSKSPEEIQYIEPDLIWCGTQVNERYNTDERIQSCFAIDEGILYYITTDRIDTGPFKSKLGAINVASAEVLWEREVDLEGINDKPFNIIGNYLYVIECGAGCYDKKTGECIWETCQTQEDLMTEDYVGGQTFCGAGQFYSKGCLFYTTDASAITSSIMGYPKELVTNIKCLDLEKSMKNKKATLKWSYMPEGCASLGTRPIVTNGQVFVTAYNCGLYVFEEDTGKVIGVCKDYYFPGMERNFLYDGKVYFFDYDYENNVRTLVCFKP